MKTFIKIIVAFICIAYLTSCNAQRKSVSKIGATIADNSMTSIDWQGTYNGILPCADCEGIKTQIELNADFNYTLKTQYFGKSDSVYQETGKFKWNYTGSAITLDNFNQQNYQVGENVLFFLDKNGKRIEGDLADNYKLGKETSEIKEKYWKLIQINGKPLSGMHREPFIKLNTNNSVSGNSSCNSFNGKYELSDGNKIRFSPFAMTKMACIDNNIEDQFMLVLEKTTSYSVANNRLVLHDEFETTFAIFEFDFFK